MSIPALKWAFAVEGLTTPQKAVLLVLAHRSNDGKGDTCYPGIDRIAREASCGRSTVIRAIAQLEEKLLIEVDRKHGGSGGGSRSNRYTLSVERKSRCETFETHSESPAVVSESPALVLESPALTPEPKEEPKGEPKERGPHLKNFKVGTPEVRAMAMHLRDDLTTADLDDFDRKFVVKNGIGTEYQSKYWRWLRNERSKSGPSKDQLRKAALLKMVDDGYLPTPREGESEAAHIARIDAFNERRIAHLR